VASRNALVRERQADPLRFAQCRSLGHEWRHKGVMQDNSKAPFGVEFGTVGLRSQCADCKTDRVKWVTRSGEVITRYDYPDGYSRHGEERLTSREWRSNFVVRIFNEVGVAS
jgi:hypothetical protein